MRKLLVICLLVSLLVSGCENKKEASQAIAREDYKDILIHQSETPDSVSFDDYDHERRVRDSNPVSDQTYNNLRMFDRRTIGALIQDQGEANFVYSPLNLYFALGLVYEGAQGESRHALDQLVNQLGMDPDALRQDIGNLYRLVYTDNEIGKLKMANSLWLDQAYSFEENFLENISPYYGDLFKVDFGSDLLEGQINAWMMDKTEDQVSYKGRPSPNEILKVISTLYFYDQWVDKFDENKTKPDQFYLQGDTSIEVDYMNTSYWSHSFRRNDYFQSTHLSMKNDFRMTFYLPNEGISASDLLSKQEALDLLLARDYEDRYNGEVVIQLPKFSYGATLDLKEGLTDLGLGPIFSQEADFSSMVNTSPLFVSNIIQSSHIAVDELGVEAASFTQIDYAGSALPKEKCEMILNRPFVFTITNWQGICLYVGLVNNPLED